MTPEVAAKHARVVALLDRLGLDSLVLRRPGNVAWLSGGGRTHILATPEAGVAVVRVRRDGIEVHTAVNEADRLRAEELAALDAEWHVLPWSAPLAVDGPDDTTYAAEVGALRRSLLPAEVDRYRDVGRAAAEAMTQAAGMLSPELSEHAAAAALGAELLVRGLDPVVLLVAGASRVGVHRHPLPTAAPLGEMVMLVACARGPGLIANLTRFVSFGPVPAEYERLLDVEAAFLDATVPGTPVGEAFAAGTYAYAAAGFPADEATRHHQGGPTGYETRDYLADATSAPPVEEWQAFAWNPSVPGLKVEDTVLATPGGVEVLTVDPAWPTVTAHGRARPAVMVRSH
ncbi:MAG TPA: M24 family metallopeptidase [Mycobacteriales bacterium]|nr:M24 family metallopeptidase [Mycobacteriales bacterium]